MGTEYILELKHISKSFPGVKALDDVTLCVRPGTVHSLMGENGAGKSTLMNLMRAKSFWMAKTLNFPAHQKHYRIMYPWCIRN